MNRAKEILEQIQGAVGGAQLKLPGTYLQCQSCGAIFTNPSGILAPDGTRDPQVNFAEGSKRCPKCGGPLTEVHKSSASVMGGQGGTYAGAVPGGALHGGAFH